MCFLALWMIGYKNAKGAFDEMRNALEGLAIRVAVTNITEWHFSHLERLLDEMDDCAKTAPSGSAGFVSPSNIPFV